MDSKIIDGKSYASILLDKIGERVAFLKETHSITPGLVTILVGDNPASSTYIKNKIKAADKVGIYSEICHLSESTSIKDLEEVIQKYNEDQRFHGVMLQLPLPSHLDPNVPMNIINPLKDVDGFSNENIGLLCANNHRFVPCTALGIVLLLEHVFGKNGLFGKRVAIIGRSDIVGKPTAMALLHRNCTVTILHSHSKDPKLDSARADIVIVAVGKSKLIKEDWIKRDACVIDVGINRVDGRIVGDVDYEGVFNKASHITPVPGGVGPMTVACLINNCVLAAYLQNDLNYAI
jgi:methylenetetrahydrofolate dehydrogenase (NADP+) / methenyltetrahydrofolate cyclohydrolase